MNQRCERLTREEVIALVNKAKDGCEDSRNRVIMSVYPLILKIAKDLGDKFRSDRDDACHVAIVKCCEVFHNYNPYDSSPTTYFGKVAYHHITQWCKYRDCLFKLPLAISKSRKYTKEKSKDVHKSTCMSLRYITSLEVPSQSGGFLRNEIPSGESSIEITAEHHEQETQLRDAVRRLRDRYRTIIEMRLMNMTLADIAHRLNLTKQRVQVLEKEAKQSLVRAINSN